MDGAGAGASSVEVGATASPSGTNGTPEESTCGMGISSAWKCGAANAHLRSDCQGRTSGTEPSLGIHQSYCVGFHSFHEERVSPRGTVAMLAKVASSLAVGVREPHTITSLDESGRSGGSAHVCARYILDRVDLVLEPAMQARHGVRQLASGTLLRGVGGQ